MSRVVRYLLLLNYFWIGLFISDGISQINLEIDQTEITVGDPIEAIISVRNPESRPIVWPENESFAPLEVLRMDTLEVKKGESRARFLLTGFEPGPIEAKQLPIVILSSEGYDSLFVTLPFVTVTSVLSEADTIPEIRDIHPPIKLRLTFADILPLIIGLLALGIIGYTIWRYILKKRQSDGDIVEWIPPPRPAHDIALDKLVELRDKELWQNGYVKQFYSELTKIIKEYLENRYNFLAMEMTTYEILSAKDKWVVADNDFLDIKRLLTSGDLVKFARFKPGAHENEKHLNCAFRFVENTKLLSETIQTESTNPPSPNVAETMDA